MPDLPAHIPWPTYQAEDLFASESHKSDKAVGQPLDFIAQINLSEIKGISYSPKLPGKGFLYFFFQKEEQPDGSSASERGASRVIYYDGGTDSLIRSSSIKPSSNLCSVKFEDSYFFDEGLFSVDPNYFDEYWDVLQSFSAPESRYRLLGAPYLVQVGGAMRLSCEQNYRGIFDQSVISDTDIEEKLKRWTLLLQVDSDIDGPGWMWGDNGSLYFWIKEEDLARNVFDDHWHAIQSC